MAGTVSVDGITYELQEGNSQWERKVGSGTEVAQTDAAPPSQIAEEYDAIEVKPATNLKIDIEENPKLTVYKWTENNRGEAADLKDDQFTSPKDKGQHIYEVLATWKNGEVSYTLVIEVR